MSELPTILVTNGWKTDRNRKLTEIVIPSTVKTLNAPTKVTFMGKALNAVPSAAAALQELEAPNTTSISASLCYNFANLIKIAFPLLQNIENALPSQNTSVGAFANCTRLTSLNLPLLTMLYSRSHSAINTYNDTSVAGAFFGCTGLPSISLPALTSISCYARGGKSGAFFGCTGLVSIDLPALVSLYCESLTAGNYSTGYAGAFYGCTGLVSVSLPSLTSITNGAASNYSRNGSFYGCTSLTSVSLPVLQTCADGNQYCSTFGGCTALENVQLGSVGHPVTSLGAYMFKDCTQSNLTITVYTAGGAAISGSPWGATNATIVYEVA